MARVFANMTATAIVPFFLMSASMTAWIGDSLYKLGLVVQREKSFQGWNLLFFSGDGFLWKSFRTTLRQMDSRQIRSKSESVKKISQDLQMLSRSLSDWQLLTLNVMISVSQFVRNSQLCHKITKSLLSLRIFDFVFVFDIFFTYPLISSLSLSLIFSLIHALMCEFPSITAGQ